MKTNYLTTLLGIIFLGLISFSCNEEDEGSSNGSNNHLKTGQIELKTYPNASNKISFTATAMKITINWGDGSIDEITPNGAESEFFHEYPNQNFQTISITTENLTSFILFSYGNELRFGNSPNLKTLHCSSSKKITVLDVSKCTALTFLDCASNQLTSLDLSKCTALTSLDYSYNQLTSLDISKNTALKGINCSGNYMTAQDLNSLFKSLPIVDYGSIICGANSGLSDCDRTIATKKGWEVRAY